MVDFVRGGNFFSSDKLDLFNRGNFKKSSLIALDCMEDDKLYVRDGHHRVFAIWLAGRDYLHETEYTIDKKLYKQYDSINLEKGWVTPFILSKHVRRPDFIDFKVWILSLYKIWPKERHAGIKRIIKESRKRYRIKRKHFKIEEFLNEQSIALDRFIQANSLAPISQ